MAIATRTMTAASPKLVAAIFFGVLFFILIVGFIVIKFTSPATRAADDILTTIATRGADAAWRDASPDFRQAVGEAQFAAFVTAHRLATFQSASWTRTSVSGSTAYLRGSVSLAGSSPRVRVGLVYGVGGWHLGALAILDGTPGGLP